MASALGNYLRSIRGTTTLREFAAKCGISHTHLDSIEKGIDPRTKKPVSISIETLKIIADGLGVDFVFLANLAADNNEFSLLNRYIKNRISGKSYKEFSEETGIDFHIMELIEQGSAAIKEKYPGGSNRKTSLDASELNALAEVLDVDPVYIFCLYDGYNPHRVVNVKIPPDDMTPASTRDKLSVQLRPVDLQLFGDTSSDLSQEETALLKIYRALNPEGQEKLLSYADDLEASGKYIKSGSFKLGNAKMA